MELRVHENHGQLPHLDSRCLAARAQRARASITQTGRCPKWACASVGAENGKAPCTPGQVVGLHQRTSSIQPDRERTDVCLTMKSFIRPNKTKTIQPEQVGRLQRKSATNRKERHRVNFSMKCVFEPTLISTTNPIPALHPKKTVTGHVTDGTRNTQRNFTLTAPEPCGAGTSTSSSNISSSSFSSSSSSFPSSCELKKLPRRNQVARLSWRQAQTRASLIS